jgi:transposase
VTRRELNDGEWELIEPFLPIGRYGPFPQHLRDQFEGVIWRFRTGSQWREMPEEFGAWQTVYDRFTQWRDVGVFAALMEGMIAEAARRGQADMSLVSVDSTVARAHHDAAGMVVEPEVLAALKGRGAGKGATETGQIAPVAGGSPAGESERAERRRLRRRRRAGSRRQRWVARAVG